MIDKKGIVWSFIKNGELALVIVACYSYIQKFNNQSFSITLNKLLMLAVFKVPVIMLPSGWFAMDFVFRVSVHLSDPSLRSSKPCCSSWLPFNQTVVFKGYCDGEERSKGNK